MHMHKLNLPHKPVYHASGIDENEYSKEAYDREKKVKLFLELRDKEKVTEEIALKAVNVSRATMYRWKSSYKKYGLSGIENDSCAPKNKRKNAWSQKEISLVLKIRKANPVYGKKKIREVLDRDYNIRMSESKVGRILSKLLRDGKIERVSSYAHKKRVSRNRRFKGHSKAWKYGSKAKEPGEFLQIDHMTINENGQTLKEFHAVDPVSKTMFAQVYSAATSNIAATFLQEAITFFSFNITSIQVDGGSEFMGKFENFCHKSNIELYVLPPRRPQYNGCVERSNQTIKNEFYQFYSGNFTVSSIRPRLKRYIHKYNTFRPHQALQNKTPMQYLKQLNLGSQNVS